MNSNNPGCGWLWHDRDLLPGVQIVECDFPSLPSFFPALSFALFFARAPLSERLEQARS